jgi:hypothetical protein
VKISELDENKPIYHLHVHVAGTERQEERDDPERRKILWAPIFLIKYKKKSHHCVLTFIQNALGPKRILPFKMSPFTVSSTKQSKPKKNILRVDVSL